MLFTALALLIGSTVIGTAGTFALFEFFVRRANATHSNATQSHAKTHVNAGF
jgi:hypothetical protein